MFITALLLMDKYIKPRRKESTKIEYNLVIQKRKKKDKANMLQTKPTRNKARTKPHAEYVI